MATATTCRAVSGYTAGSSTSRTARVGADAASSGRATHMSARGRSAVRYVSRRTPPAVPAVSPGHAPRFPTREGVLPCRAHAPARNPPFATLALGRAPRTRLPFVPRLLRLTPLPTRYPSHRPGRSAVRCRAVRSSSPSKRGEKAQLSTGKDGRGKTLFTSAVSPPDAEIGACPPSRSAWAFSGCRRRAFIQPRENVAARACPPRTDARRADRATRRARLSRQAPTSAFRERSASSRAPSDAPS